jgi:hypothetical protein
MGINVKSQKAAGVLALAARCWPWLAGEAQYTPLVRPGQFGCKSIALLPYSEPFIPCFARPCPVRPRHGFVESQRCDTWGQLMAVVHATAREDPEAEVLLMQQLTGQYSGVMTPAGISLGKGHDGATNGTSAVFIPTNTPKDVFAYIVKHADMYGITNTPYVEVVEDKGQFVAVQVRDGPKQPIGTNYVPHRVEKANKIIQPPRGSGGVDELIKWEKSIHAYEGRKDVVVHLPLHTLSSHWAVHAITAGLPVVTDCTIVLPLEPSDNQPAKLNKRHLQQLARMIRFHLHEKQDAKTGPAFYHGVHMEQHQMAQLALAALHAQHGWGPEWHLNHLRAAGVVFTIKLVLASCVGEARHFYRAGPGLQWYKEIAKREEDPADTSWADRMDRAQSAIEEGGYGARAHCTPWEELDGDVWDRVFPGVLPNDGRPRLEIIGQLHAHHHSIDRHTTYYEVLALPPGELRRWGRAAELDLSGPGWLGSFGGHGWKSAAENAVGLLDAVAEFIGVPTAGNWQKVLWQWNRTTLSAHNGGKVFNKWMYQHMADNISQRPGLGFCSPVAASLVQDKRHWFKAFRGQEPKVEAPKEEPTVDLIATAKEMATEVLAAQSPILGDILPKPDTATFKFHYTHDGDVTKVDTHPEETKDDYKDVPF